MAEDKPVFSSGLPSLDQRLHGILAGDNVVWQVNDTSDFLPFLIPFCRQAQREGKTLVYFRFAQHAYLLPPDINAHCYEIDPSAGFEPFISEILDTIERHGRGVCYVFDCLSDLIVDWYSDRMLGNFFMLTCPLLYDLDTVTYFVLLRDRHTPLAIDAIHSTAQVILDVYRSDRRLYLLPIKVWKRYSPTLYMLHAWEKNDQFCPVTRSTTTTELLLKVPQPWVDFNIDRRDMWTTIFMQAQRVSDELQAGRRTRAAAEGTKEQLIKMILARDPDVVALCRRYLTLADLLAVGRRMIGTGLVGGKSVGMLLARAILNQDQSRWFERLEPHDSFFIGSDVFYTYVIQNKCWWQRHRLRLADDMYEQAQALQERLLLGTFPRDIVEQFRNMLNYFGQSPIIVRSSSLLEDAYGNAFSGKYESVFCANQGTPEERLEAFIEAVRHVYASTMSRDALAYRLHKGLIQEDEQMALLVQRVSGAFYERLYFPQVAGVGYSFNPFVWNSRIDPQAGVLRLVFGLGTRAVEGHGDDYTRIIALNAPLLQPENSFDQLRKYTQRIVDVLDLEHNRLVSLDFEEVAKSAAALPMDIFAAPDSEMEARARALNRNDVFTWMLSFDRLLKETTFVEDLGAILRALAKAYDHAVDIEFTANFVSASDYRINVLQCRPFQFAGEIRTIPELATIPAGDVLLQTSGPIIGQGIVKVIDRIVYVLPARYGLMSMSDRYSVARLVGDITNASRASGSIMLVGPGRWGTKMPALGIPVSFSEIRNAAVLCEIVTMHEGLTPDISLGTHFFNDLVEMEIVYMAVFPGKAGYVLNETVLRAAPNQLLALAPGAGRFADAILVVDTHGLRVNSSVVVHVDPLKQQGVLFFTTKEF